MEETLNALISETFLGLSNQGALTLTLRLRCLEDNVVNYGNVALEHHLMDGSVSYTSLANRLVSRILNVLQKEAWEGLPQTPVRIKVLNGRIVMLGHFIKDRWVSIDDEVKAFLQETSPVPEPSVEESSGTCEEVRSDSEEPCAGDEGDNESPKRSRSRRSTSRSK